jgi:murein DD-endopeptidase MepM/ murein hydrolase activator NlpD
VAQLLWTLLLCSVWSGVVWLVSQWLLQRYRSLGQWPGVYWCLALLCFMPLLPMPEFIEASVIPAALLQDTLLSVQQLTAQPQHQALLSAPLPMALFWQCAWLLLAAISLFRLGKVVQQWRQLQQFIGKAQPLSAAQLFGEEWPVVAVQLPHLGKLEILQTDQLMSPFVAGWQKMVLVLPQYIWDLSTQQRQLLITHELIHLQRRDPQQLLLWRILAAICWFNPVLRQLEQAFIRTMELTVDQQVLAAQPAQALLYGQTLLHSLKQSLSPKAAPSVPGGMPGFIQANADQCFYQQRLTQLFRPLPGLTSRQRWLVFVALCTFGLLLKFGSAHWQMAAPLSDWRLPLAEVRISSFYGHVHPIRQNRPHAGVDFAANIGVPVLAAQQGKVLIADDQSLHPRFGKVVLIDHGQGYQTLYSHLDQIQIAVGSRVATGQPIGTVGETGRVTGPHLHFELLLHGEPQDPMLFLK